MQTTIFQELLLLSIRVHSINAVNCMKYSIITMNLECKNVTFYLFWFFLQEKLDRLYDLDRMIQEQSFQVTSLKEDRVRIYMYYSSLHQSQLQ